MGSRLRGDNNKQNGDIFMTQRNSNALNVFLLCILFLSLVEGLILGICRPTLHGLQGSYYGNKTWSGNANGTGLDTEFSTRTLARIKKVSLKMSSASNGRAICTSRRPITTSFGPIPMTAHNCSSTEILWSETVASTS